MSKKNLAVSSVLPINHCLTRKVDY